MATSRSRTPVKAAAAKKSAPAKKAAASKKSAAPAVAKKAAPEKKSAPAKKAAAKNTAPKKAAAPNKAASKAAAPKKAVAARGGSRGAVAPAKAAAPSRNASTAAKSTPARKTRGMNPQNDLELILQDLLKDIYYAEKKLVRALGKMSKHATNPKLREAFTTHQGQTEEQVAKLEQAFSLMGLTPKAKKCAAMDGLLEESDEHMSEYNKGAGLDAALIVGAQKVEHYEIASYGSMRSIARSLGLKEVAAIFETIREQESDTDELLTTIAEGRVNEEAEASHEDAGDDDNESNSGKGGNGATSARSSEKRSADGSRVEADSENDGTGRGAVSSLTDGNDRGEASETGEPMGY